MGSKSSRGYAGSRCRGEKLDTLEKTSFFDEVSAYVQHTNQELVEEIRVAKGAIDMMDMSKS